LNQNKRDVHEAMIALSKLKQGRFTEGGVPGRSSAAVWLKLP